MKIEARSLYFREHAKATEAATTTDVDRRVNCYLFFSIKSELDSDINDGLTAHRFSLWF